MLTTSNSNVALNLPIGKFVTVKCSFQSDEMLTGKLIRFNPGTYYTVDEEMVNKAFQIVYPAGAGVHPFTKISCKNYEADLKVINAFNFEIHYHFFVSRRFNKYFPDSVYTNDTAFLGDDDYGDIGFNVQVDDERVIGKVPFQIYTFCRDNESLVFNPYVDGIPSAGYSEGQDLRVEIVKPNSTDNNFFVGLVNLNAINNNQEIVPGLVMSYAKIDSDVRQVKDLPYSAFIGGEGFNQLSGGEYRGYVDISANVLDGSDYYLYVVYYSEGTWKSCKSQTLKKASSGVFNVGADWSVSDYFGNTTTYGCVTGLSPNLPVTLNASLDVASFNTQLASKGYSGTANDYIAGITVHNGTKLLQFTGDINQVTVSDFLAGGDSQPYVKYRFVLPDGRIQVFKVYFDLHYNSKETTKEIEVIDNDSNERVFELCEGGDYRIDESLSGCLLLQSINGGVFTDMSTAFKKVLNGDNINLDSFDTAVLKNICTDGDDEAGNNGCQPCGVVDLEYSVQGVVEQGETVYRSLGIDANSDFETISIVINGTTFNSFPILVETSGNPIEITSVHLEANGCIWEWSGSIEWDERNGREFLIELNNQIILESGAFYDCDIETEDPPIGGNLASIIYDCSTDGEITLSVNTSFTGTPESEEFLISLDGGLTFVPAPGTITGEPGVYVVYNATFSDGDDIHIHQNILCAEEVICENSREIALEVDSNDELVITLTDNFDSVVLMDYMHISLDAGITWLEPINLLTENYTPIALVGNENIIVETTTAFEDECNDLVVTETLEVLSNNTDPACPGYGGYSLDINNNNGVFTIIVSGDTSQLEINELLWTNNGANPFDANGSGVPYLGNIETTGLVIAGWKIKLPGCPVEIIYDNEYQQEPPTVIVNESDGINYRQVINNETGNVFDLTQPGNPNDPNTLPSALASSRNYDNMLVYRNNMALIGGDTSFQGYTLLNGQISLHNEVPLQENETLVIIWL